MDTYTGLITSDGSIQSNRKILSFNNVKVNESSFSRAIELFCPDDWKSHLGASGEQRTIIDSLGIDMEVE